MQIIRNSVPLRPLRHKELCLICGCKTSGWTNIQCYCGKYILLNIQRLVSRILVFFPLSQFKRGLDEKIAKPKICPHDSTEFYGITFLHKPVFKKPVPAALNTFKAHLVHLGQGLHSENNINPSHIVIRHYVSVSMSIKISNISPKCNYIREAVSVGWNTAIQTILDLCKYD